MLLRVLVSARRVARASGPRRRERASLAAAKSVPRVRPSGRADGRNDPGRRLQIGGASSDPSLVGGRLLALRRFSIGSNRNDQPEPAGLSDKANKTVAPL